MTKYSHDTRNHEIVRRALLGELVEQIRQIWNVQFLYRDHTYRFYSSIGDFSHWTVFYEMNCFPDVGELVKEIIDCWNRGGWEKEANERPCEHNYVHQDIRYDEKRGVRCYYDFFYCLSCLDRKYVQMNCSEVLPGGMIMHIPPKHDALPMHADWVEASYEQ